MAPSRRVVLRTASTLLGVGFAGCTGRLSSFGETPEGWPRRYTDEADPVRWRLDHGTKRANGPVPFEDGVIVTWGREFGTGAISNVTSTAGTVDWHREIPYPPYRAPTIHGNDVYLLTGIRSGHERDEQQLRRFGLDGTEHWQTEPKRGLLDLHAIGDGRAYLGTETRNPGNAGREFPLYAVSLTDGRREWTRETAPSWGGYYHDGQLLAEIGNGAIASFDPVDGTEQWRTDGRMLTDGGHSPALGNGVTFLKRDENVAALVLRDGSAKWEIDTGGIVWGAAVSDRTVVVSMFSGRIYGFDRTDGTEQWRIETEGSTSLPLLGDGQVFVTDDAALHAIDVTTGERRWRVESAGSVRDYGRGMVVVGGGSQGDRVIMALDADDGSELWRYETPTASGITVGEWHIYASLGDEGVVALGVH